MQTTMTVKGQVTIPKQMRDALGLEPGAKVDFGINSQGEVVLHKVDDAPARRRKDRFEAARGKADIKWRTRELMALLRDDE